jgi:uncharacterized coiled-coil DUF342 family protein
MAENILRAMQKCHNAIESKLSSQRWKMEMERGETLAERLEQSTRLAEKVTGQLNAALQDFERYQDQAEAWSQKRVEAQAITEKLRNQINEAQDVNDNFNNALNQRRNLLTAIAANTSGLVEVIESARHDDEMARPGNGKGGRVPREVAPKPVQPVEWQTARLHPAAGA